MKFLKIIILIFIILNEIESITFDKYEQASVWQKNRIIRKEKKVCLEICNDCFSEVNFLLFISELILNINLYIDKFAADLESCLLICMHKKKRSIKVLVNWWKRNSFDFESSICIFNKALKYDL